MSFLLARLRASLLPVALVFLAIAPPISVRHEPIHDPIPAATATASPAAPAEPAPASGSLAAAS